ncbi:MAG: hypothetical protein AB1606_07280, partial [Nitrospirota bacterium]
KKERESARKDKPFTHAKGVTASGWINPQTGDMHLEDYCRGLLTSRFNDDEGLRFLIWAYQKHLNQDKALDKFESLAKELMQGDEPYLTKDHWTVFCKAEAGNIEAIQRLVRANPFSNPFALCS